MGTLDDLPQRHHTHYTADAAAVAFTKAVQLSKVFVLQSSPLRDYGVDVVIEACDGGAMTNLYVVVQLKGTEQQTNVDGSVSVSVSRRNLNYLLAQRDSLYVCYHIPSDRLLVRYALDVYKEYQHKETNWLEQEEITIRFHQTLDTDFISRLHAKVVARGNSAKGRRLLWADTPPERFPAVLEQSVPMVEVPTDPNEAATVLRSLEQKGEDKVISQSFSEFEAVLSSSPLAMLPVYLAEINLGINGEPHNPERVKSAIQQINDALQREEIQFGSAKYCEGNGWMALGDDTRAEDAYSVALKELDNFPDIAAQCYKNMGSLHESHGYEESARNHYERAIELCPHLGEAILALGIWHVRNDGDPKMALKCFDNVGFTANSSCRMTVVQGWRVQSLFQLGDHVAAFREIQVLLGETPQQDWIWPWCARLVVSYGGATGESSARAVDFWEMYLRNQPADDNAKLQRLLCAAHANAVGIPTRVDFDECLEEAEALSFSLGDEIALLWDQLGHWADQEGKTAQAESSFRKAHALDPLAYSRCLGALLNDHGRHTESLEVLLPHSESSPIAESWFQIAVAKEGNDDISGSITAYHRAIELDSDYAVAWFNLGGMYWNTGDRIRARETWGEAIRRFPKHRLREQVLQRFAELVDVENCGDLPP